MGRLCDWMAKAFPALGDHACHVVGAYAATAVVLGALVWLTLAANRRARAALGELEKGRRGDG